MSLHHQIIMSLTVVFSEHNCFKLYLITQMGFLIAKRRIQCAQIWRFFVFWASIQSRWQQLLYPNTPHCQAILAKVSKSFIFQVKSFLGNFYRHLAIFFWSHWLGFNLLQSLNGSQFTNKKSNLFKTCCKKDPDELSN